MRRIHYSDDDGEEETDIEVVASDTKQAMMPRWGRQHIEVLLDRVNLRALLQLVVGHGPETWPAGQFCRLFATLLRGTSSSAPLASAGKRLLALARFQVPY